MIPEVLARSVRVGDPPSSCEDLRNCRTIWNIVWSCVVTLFACTWVAIHPNLPRSKSKGNWFIKILRRTRIMVYALLGPEFIILWAWRQRYIASKTSHVLTGWSRVHGFLAAMGGFVLDDGNSPRTLSFEDIEELVRKDEIEYPIITKAEIKDKSKGDLVTKGLVLTQTTWFLLQCIARARQHLSLTELELSTAAFALLNLITYGLWWDKPLNVRCPVKVRRKHVCGQETAMNEARGEQEADYNEDIPLEGNWRRHSRRNVLNAVRSVFLMVFGPFRSMLVEDKEDDIFFAGENEEKGKQQGAFGGAVVVATFFGGVHCIGMNFSFPSRKEKFLWGLSSISITVIPMLIQGAISALMVETRQKMWLADYICYSIFLYPLSILYVLARATLLVLALMVLRSLPNSALQTVHWTTFLPHI